MREATWKQIALLAILVTLIEKMILQMANVLVKQDILMMEMKFVLNAIILGLFFLSKDYIKKFGMWW